MPQKIRRQEENLDLKMYNDSWERNRKLSLEDAGRTCVDIYWGSTLFK